MTREVSAQSGSENISGERQRLHCPRSATSVHGKAKLDSPSYVLTIQRPAVERFVQAPDWLFFLLLFTRQLTAPHEASNSMAMVSSPLFIWCFLFSVVFSAFGPWLLARRRRKGGKDDSKLPVLFTFSLGFYCRWRLEWNTLPGRVYPGFFLSFFLPSWLLSSRLCTR